MNSDDEPISEFNQKFMGIKLDKGDFLQPSHGDSLKRKNMKIIEDNSEENSS